VNWTQRILDFPVRSAAVDDFLCDLRAKGTGDLHAVLATLNESGLCREVVEHWTSSGWIVVAPNTPLLALAGPAFDRTLTLRGFCGEGEEAEPVEGAEPLPEPAQQEESDHHGNS